MIVFGVGAFSFDKRVENPLPLFLLPNTVFGFDFGVVRLFVVPVEDVKEYTYPGFLIL